MEDTKYKLFFKKYMSVIRYIQNVRMSKGFDQVYAEKYMHYIFDIAEKPVIKRKFSKKQVFLNFLSDHLHEIFLSYEYLKDAKNYISSFPKNKKISKVRYLIYTYENYLNEIYLLKLRIKNYYNMLLEWYKVDRRAKNVRKIVFPLFKELDRFRFLEDVRGDHVHKFRYKPENFAQLESLEILAKTGNSIILKLAELKFKNVRIELEKSINTINAYIEQVLGILLEPTSDIIFSKKSIVYPSRFPVRENNKVLNKEKKEKQEQKNVAQATDK
jgi:hypothetical protein